MERVHSLGDVAVKGLLFMFCPVSERCSSEKSACGEFYRGVGLYWGDEEREYGWQC